VAGRCDAAATGGAGFEFRGSQVLTIMADTLRLELPMLPPRDSQLTVWWASDLRLRCTRPACRELTILARPWVGTFLGPARPNQQRDLRDIYQKTTIRAQELYV